VGGDNTAAARKQVTIAMTDRGYELFMKNQFGLRCDLEFDVHGDPARLLDCKAQGREWDPAGPIPLACKASKSGRACTGSWTSRNGIVTPKGFGTLAFQIAKP
jgi:hypothetical protein